MITVENISKTYGDKKILDNISLKLRKGEITVLFGPSGCGKTTLCRNLTFLEKPDSGVIKIDNEIYDFNTQIEVKPHPKLNMVFQQLFLWPHLTNEQNIKLSIKNYTKEVEKKFEHLTKFLNIESILNQYPNQSSLGQKQRVAIARVLILNPEFIFFDEMTSALDIVQTNNIIKLLLELKNQGIGILIITHNIYFMTKIADNLIFMSNGRIIETGSIEIIKKPKTNYLKTFLGYDE